MDPKCPTCGHKLKTSTAAGDYRPFCSERCRTIDLGSWLNGAFRIGSPISEEDLDQGMSGDGGDDGEDDGRTPQ